MTDIVSHGFRARAAGTMKELKLPKYEEGANDETGLPANVERFRGRASGPTAWNIRGQDISQDLFLNRRKSSH
jgi:hypothetical protein